MLNITLNEDHRIVIIEPEGKLSANDFQSAVTIIDPFIGEAGSINGLIIAAEKFPGWEDFSALVSHLFFVKEHHKKITTVAFVSDAAIGKIAERLVKHFVSAEIKAFSYNEIEQAKAWIIANS